LIIYTF